MIVDERLRELGTDAFAAARKGGLERSFVYEILYGKKVSVLASSLPKLAKALEWDVSHLETVLGLKKPPINAIDEERLRAILGQALRLRMADDAQRIDWIISALKDPELLVDDPDAVLKHIGMQSVAPKEPPKAIEDKARRKPGRRSRSP